MVSLDEILRDAATLEPEERASLAAQLIHSLDRSAYYVTDEEVVRRIEEAERDPSVLISFEELQAGLKRSGSPVS